MVNTCLVPASRVVVHLKENGLVVKEPEALEGGAALGLKLQKADDGQLILILSAQTLSLRSVRV